MGKFSSGNSVCGTLIAAILLTLPAAAVIVDRIAISAGNRVITDSEIDLRIRLTAFQNGETPSFGPDSRKKAAQLLIDEKLVEREMDVGHYPRLNEDGRKQLLADYARTNYKSDPEALRRALSGYGLTMGDLEDDLARQSDLLTFLSLRFRPAVQVSDQDVRQYYESRPRPPGGNGSNNTEVTLNDLRERFERQITSDRADADMNAWIKDQRQRTKIEYLEKELAP
jgi:hypothetical protein